MAEQQPNQQSTGQQDEYSTFNDTPHLESSDFYEPFIKRVVNEIRWSPAPKTIAITGYWGSGKTSALAQIYERSTGNKPPFVGEPQKRPNSEQVVGVWFEAWRYQQEEQPIVALLHTIKQQFTMLEKLKRNAKKIINVSFLGSLSILDSVIHLASGSKANLSKLPEIAKKYEKDNLLSMLHTDQVHLALQEGVKALLGKAQKLVIFIDDLDRCQPEMALKLLEGLKLYLNIKNCVVVMAIDQSQLEKITRGQQQDQHPSHFIGVEYLEKLCQDPHRLPLMSNDIGAAIVREQLMRAFKNRTVDNNRQELDVLISNIDEKIKQYRCLPANPRRVKMITNRMIGYLRCLKADDINHKLVAEGVIFLTVLYVSYRQIYEQIEHNNKFFDQLITFCDTSAPIEEEKLKNTSLEGLIQPTEEFHRIGEHPSDLREFRLERMIQTIQQYEMNDSFVSLLKQLIDRYNGVSTK